MTEDIEAYLSSKGVQFKRNRNHVIAHHVDCDDANGNPNKTGHWYINVSGTDRHGLWDCKKCQAKGNFITLLRTFGDEPTAVTSASTDNTRKIMHAAAKMCATNLREVDVTYLKDARGLTEETVKMRGLGYTPGGTWMYDQLSQHFDDDDLLASGLVRRGEDGSLRDHFFAPAITIPYFTSNGCADLRARLIDSGKIKYMSASGAEIRVYNTNTTWGADEIVITEGEFDAMLLEQLGYRAIAIPGAGTWKVAFNGYLEDAKRVWIMQDPDEPGIKSADAIEAMVGSKAKIVRLPIPDGVEAKKVDPTYLVTTQLWNKHHFDMLFQTTARAESLLRTPTQALEQMLEDEKVGGIKTGWEMFDAALGGGGFRRANLVVPIARTNVGKSLFIINMLHAMAMYPGQENLKFLFFTLEQTGGEWIDRARRVWHFYNPECPTELVNEEAAKFWEPRLRYVEKNQLTEQEFRTAIDDFQLEFGQLPDLIAVDYLGYMAHSFTGNSTVDKVSGTARMLKAVAKDINRCIVVPSQAGRKAEHGSEIGLDDARDSGEIENTADIAIGMWSQDTMKGATLANRTGELMMKFAKTRGRGKGREVKFLFAPLSLVWIPAEDTDNTPKVKDEIRWDGMGDITWQQAIRAHALGQPPRKEL